jgi:hypothetical protein
MGKSFVGFRGFGFWSPDGVLEDWLSALVTAMEPMPVADEWQKEMKRKWSYEATAGKTGCIWPSLDDFLTTEERIQFAIDLSHAAIASVEARDVRRIGELFINLLEGKLKTTASSSIDYWDRTQEVTDNTHPPAQDPRDAVLMKTDPITFVYKELVGDHVISPWNEQELLRWMLLLHTHRIRLTKPLPLGFPDPCLLPPLTQRGAAKVAAVVWINQRDKHRSDYRYWYREYAEKYQSKSEISADEAPEIEKLRERLESDKRLESVELERD